MRPAVTASPEGSGSSTQCRLVREWCGDRGLVGGAVTAALTSERTIGWSGAGSAQPRRPSSAFLVMTIRRPSRSEGSAPDRTSS